MACLPTATYSAPGVTLYAALGGGGGGGGLQSSIQLGATFVACANDGNEGIVQQATGDIVANSGSAITLTSVGDIQIGNAASILTVGASGTITAAQTLSTEAFFCSSINGAQPGGAVPEDLTLNSLSSSAIATSSILLQGNWPVPLFQGGRFTMPNADSNVVETDVIFGGTDWFAWATYDGAVNSAVSSIGTSVLSRSTFALWAQGGLQVSWMAQGN